MTTADLLRELDRLDAELRVCLERCEETLWSLQRVREGTDRVTATLADVVSEKVPVHLGDVVEGT